MIRNILLMQCDRCGAVREVLEPRSIQISQEMPLPPGWTKHWNIVLCERHMLWVEVRVKDDKEPSQRLETTGLRELALELVEKAFQSMARDERAFIHGNDYVDHLQQYEDSLKSRLDPVPIRKKKRKRRIILEEGN